MRIGNENSGITDAGQDVTGGLVQICFDGVLHTVCDVGFDDVAAELACRSQFGDAFCKLLKISSGTLLLKYDRVIPSVLQTLSVFWLVQTL